MINTQVIKVEIPVNVSFDLDRTLTCGQTFRWLKQNDNWYGVANNTPLILNYNKTKGILKVQSNCEEIMGENLENGIIHYLGLNDSLESIKGNSLKQVEKNYPEFVPSFNEIVDTKLGIRLLRQDPWEMLVEYLLSTQSNISTIKKRCETLASFFPENQVFVGQEPFFIFPTVDQLRKLELQDFQTMLFGYRSKWLKDLVGAIDIREFRSIKNVPLEQKLNYLICFSGIGYKVANCVALFGFSDFKAFPVDVWISRFLKQNFGVTGNSESLMIVGQEIFGDFCGYIQEYIFYNIRTSSL
ncbi:MAG: DNA glycosylase [Thermotogota bacterium]